MHTFWYWMSLPVVVAATLFASYHTIFYLANLSWAIILLLCSDYFVTTTQFGFLPIFLKHMHRKSIIGEQSKIAFNKNCYHIFSHGAVTVSPVELNSNFSRWTDVLRSVNLVSQIRLTDCSKTAQLPYDVTVSIITSLLSKICRWRGKKISVTFQICFLCRKHLWKTDNSKFFE